jgi:hypothetical protein
MMRLRRASLIALSLLASAATARAECAWILWAGGVKTSGEAVHAPIEGYPTRAECMKLDALRPQSTRWSNSSATQEPE